MLNFDLLVFIIASSFTVFYLSLILEFYEKDAHFGPFQSETKKVLYLRRDVAGEIIEKYEQPVTLFEYIRRIFGVYRVEKEECPDDASFDIGCEDGEVWFVNQARMEMWECTTCLSGWLSLIPAALSLLLFPPIWAFVIWGASAGISSAVHSIVYRSQGVVMTQLMESDGDEDEYGINNS